jgi:phage I-like protein
MDGCLERPLSSNAVLPNTLSSQLWKVQAMMYLRQPIASLSHEQSEQDSAAYMQAAIVRHWHTTKTMLGCVDETLAKIHNSQQRIM